MRIHDSDKVSNALEFQEDSVDDSTVLINSSAQHQTNIESDNSSNVQNENEPQVMNMNRFNGFTQISGLTSEDEKLSDSLIYSQHDQQYYKSSSKSRDGESLLEESQVLSEFGNPIQISFDEIMSNNSDSGSIRNDTNDTEIRIKKSTQNSTSDVKKNIRRVLKHRKYYSSTQTEYGRDLVEHIPGLYRLLDLNKVDNVDKIIISKDSLKKLCNDMVPSSFKSISEISYTKLNSISFRLIGCYGNHALIVKFLLNKKIINQAIHDLLIDSQSSIEDINKPSLSPGIYLLAVNPDLGLVIHWSEFGCYEENASSQHKNNMINLHRYLTKLTDCQLCLMSDKDLESFDWNLNNSDPDEDETCYEFEVKEDRELRDDFKIHPGFKVNLSHKIKADINNDVQYNIPLRPIVVESTTNQSFITRKMAKKLNKGPPTLSKTSFSTDLRNLLEGRSLHIKREMNMEQLELLINNGFEMENELLEPFYKAIADAKLRMKERILQEEEIMKDDAEIITRMGWKKSYSIFETSVDKNSFDDSENNDDKIICEEETNRIQSKYPEVKEMIKKIQINSPAWIKLKQRYALTYLVMNNIYKLLNSGKNSEVTELAIQEFYKMFVDKETDTHKLVEKYERRSQDYFSRSDTNTFSVLSVVPTFDKLRIIQIEEQSKKFSQNKSDSEFVQDLISSPFFGKLNNIRQDVLDAFLKEYQHWREENFPNNVREVIPKFSYNKELMDKIKNDFLQEKVEIEKNEFERICNKLEENYRDGLLRLNILNMSEITGGDSFRLTYELETNRLQITIYETLFDKSDISQIQNDELYISNPILSSDFSTGQYGVDFQIDPIIYDFRKISQFDNGKFLLVLYNKESQRIEIFFDAAQQLARGFKKSHSIRPFRTLSIDENFLVAVNEPKELIAVFHTRQMELNVLSFNEDQNNLYIRDPNIQLSQWYNNTIPKIQHFLFIKDTELLCFVEKSGQTRIFSLTNQKFQPAVCNLPSNAENVLSSPDGSCIVAFVKEKEKDVSNGKEHNATKERDVCRAHVYFRTKFGDSTSKVVNLPTNLRSLEFLQFTRVNKSQIHLMSFDLQNGHLSSAIAKITIEKTQYHFQERIQNQSLGRVKLIDSSQQNVNYTFIKGKNTYFEKSVQKGQNIVIMGEKYNVIEVFSDTKLKVSGNFKQTSGFDEWMEFHVESIELKTKLNGLVDVYRLMFEKYPIENFIDPEQNQPLDLKIVLDIDDNCIEEYSEKFEDYTVENLRHSTKKIATLLRKFSVSAITFQELDIKNYSSEYELGEWIIKLCCLIPVQIAVTKDNLFQPLKDEMFWDEIDRVEFDNGYGHHVNSIANNISFGWYEGIFRHFRSKKVKVISSVGERSCEKSFLLNHLVGTSFDESAMSCAKGVWMSLVNTRKYIYVALDFERLTTAQEDLFLTLFSTIVSNLILFKNQTAINRDMFSMLQKFQDGALLFGSDSKMPQAKLCVIMKDVPGSDKVDIINEFKSKLSQLVSEEGEDNFISRMYKGGVDIIPWPTFNDATWFKTLSSISNKLIRQEANHENVRTFLKDTKVVMAKLKICDWSSLDETLIQIRIATLKRSLPAVIAYAKQLKNHDSGEPIGDPIVRLSDILHDFEGSYKILPDSAIQLYGERESYEQLFEDLGDYFEDIEPRRKSSDDSKWFANFDRFVKYIIERRVSRVRDWYTQNTDKFPQDNIDIVIGKDAIEQEISKLTLLWTLCGLTCHYCGLKCIKSRDHEDDHNCSTNHKCHVPCQSQGHTDGLIPNCSYQAGHEGKHVCNKINHMCGKPCNLNDKHNCQKVCSKEIGHDGEHLCPARHYCGEGCSLSTYTHRGDYRCHNKCMVPYDEEHDTHRCEYDTCPIKCPVSNCQRKCQSNDHFHSYSDLQVNHFCGDEHSCQEFCEEPGLCKIITIPRRQIAFTKYIQLNERLKCNKKIPPNEFKHTGKHTHAHDEKEQGFHYCDTKCQFCEYFCTLPYGHMQIHDTRHGNMTNMAQTEFTGAEHKLRDDQGTFFLCNLHCKDAGRHRHIDYCQNADNCKLGQDMQHIDEEVQPNPDKPKDFISHKLFWERTGFKDPYSTQEQQEFAKCDHECPDEKHHRSQESSATPPIKSFCESQLFHAPHNPDLDPPNNYGYVSSDGHHFDCEIPSTREAAFHIIFVLDRSGSMSGKDRKPIPDFPVYNELVRNHDNRIGITYQAIYQFMDARVKSTQANQNGAGASSARDSISLVLFDNEVIVPFENRDLTDPKDLLNIMLQHQARNGTGTDFGLAIQKAGFLISSYFDNTKTNIIIFITGDGECDVPTDQLNAICKQSQTRGSPLYLYTVLFTNDSHSHSLEEMAKIAQSYHPKSLSSSALRCQFTSDISGINLVTGVGESLRKHKPALLKKNLVQ